MERLGHCRPSGGFIVFQINIREHIERSGNNERFVEADSQRPAGDFFAIINLPAVALGRAGHGLALFAVWQHLPAKAKVPLANNAGVVAVVLEKFWRG